MLRLDCWSRGPTRGYTDPKPAGLAGPRDGGEVVIVGKLALRSLGVLSRFLYLVLEALNLSVSLATAPCHLCLCLPGLPYCLLSYLLFQFLFHFLRSIPFFLICLVCSIDSSLDGEWRTVAVVVLGGAGLHFLSSGFSRNFFLWPEV